MKSIALAALSVAAVVLAGCGGADPDAPAKEPRTTTTSASAVEKRTPEVDADLQEFIDEFGDLQKSLEAYWADQIDGYEPPTDTLIFSGETDDPSDYPTCDGEPVEAENGFFCPPDNTVILDVDWMYAEYVRIGDLFLYVVLAHEYGHSAQANLAADQAPAEADEEIQADCFSGAFVQDTVDSGEYEEEDGDEQEINLTLAGVAGDFGTDDSHGTLASRASAFEYGRSDGAAACLTPNDYRR